jgi:transporter
MIPITLDSLGKEEKSKYLLVHTLVLQVLAGEIGSFLFPYTSLSSLYLFLEYGYSFLSFLRVSFIFFFFGGIFLLPYVLIFKKEENTAFQGNFRTCSLDKNALFHFCIFSLLTFLCYLRILPILLLFPILALYTLTFHRRIFLKLDGFLFLFLFLILLLKESTYHSMLLNQLFGEWILGHETSRGFILSEIFTRLPASVLLSSFSTKGRQLIVASILSTIHPFAWNYSSIMAIVFLRRAKLVNLKLFLLHYLILHGQMLIILLFLAFFTGNF